MAKVAAKGAEARQGVEAEQAWNGRGSRDVFSEHGKNNWCDVYITRCDSV